MKNNNACHYKKQALRKDIITESLLFSNYWSYLSIPFLYYSKHLYDKRYIIFKKFILSLFYFYIGFIRYV
ncbi:hypothetical protein SAMN05216235_1545 [Salinicoccus halodurans]|uniref:Uncharacterized protein n=1 Tax=Salinicoccus halodurans TaxID=407035 RepID=A0AA94KW19_9STAP|nr:hypothetical protein SAMN05216235_1545 [Salinicoccus halodurans]